MLVTPDPMQQREDEHQLFKLPGGLGRLPRAVEAGKEAVVRENAPLSARGGRSIHPRLQRITLCSHPTALYTGEEPAGPVTVPYHRAAPSRGRRRHPVA